MDKYETDGKVNFYASKLFDIYPNKFKSLGEWVTEQEDNSLISATSSHED